MTVFSHCTENHIFFFQASWKDGVSKKIALEFELSCIIGKYDISFSRKYDLTSRRKMKDDLSQKKYTEIWNLLQMFWKDGLPKKDRAGTRSFLYYLERWYFFPGTWYFFPGWKTREEFSRDTRKYDIFYLICSTSPCKNKSQRRSYPAKIHLKRIGIPDWHPKKGSSNSLYLHGDHFSRFDILQFSKKRNPRKLNI